MQRKQARTGEEREEEEEEQISESESEDEENEIIYNPKNLPLGWDGKVTVNAGWVGDFTWLHATLLFESALPFSLIFVCLSFSANPVLVI